MRSNKRKRSAYRRGDRLMEAMKRVSILLSIIGAISLIIFIIMVSADLLIIREIEVSGNQHLDKTDLLRGSGLHEGISLLTLSLNDAERWLKDNPWIREVSLRKQFPDTLVIRVKETTPRALLNHRGSLFLIDDRGSIIQEITDKTYRFLPVINIDPKTNRRELMESLRLVQALEEGDLLSKAESIDIGLESYGLFMRIDGKLLKIGYDNYSEKLKKWATIHEELKRADLKMEYVDLRFKDVIIKPIAKQEREDEKRRVNRNT
ncbi:MAG: hypothetical protein Fur0020_04400 [Thermodesulfovibrionia bacterium]